MLAEGVVSVVVVGALVEVIKLTDKVSRNYLPLVSVIIGVVLGLLEGYAGTGFAVAGALNGLVVGLSASGIYDNLQKGVQTMKK